MSGLPGRLSPLFLTVTVQQGEEILAQLLKEQAGKSFTLPLLVEEKSWLSDFWTSLMQRIRDWIAGIPSVNGLSLPIREIIFILLVVVAGLGAIFLIRFLINLLRSRKHSLPGSLTDRNGAASAVTGGGEFFARISEAIKRGDYARAARLRWKLFLEHYKLPRSLTPLEFFNNTRSVRKGFEAKRLPFVGHHNRLMFSKQTFQSADYELFEATISELEAPRFKHA